MVSTSVLQRLRAAPAASDKAASFPARPWTAAVRESSWHPLGMPLPAASAPKHSCATTAEVKILHWGPSHVEIASPAVFILHYVRYQINKAIQTKTIFHDPLLLLPKSTHLDESSRPLHQCCSCRTSATVLPRHRRLRTRAARSWKRARSSTSSACIASHAGAVRVSRSVPRL